MFAITSGLDHGAVKRLKASWEKVPGKYLKSLSEMHTIMDPSMNFRKYRNLISNARVSCESNNNNKAHLYLLANLYLFYEMNSLKEISESTSNQFAQTYVKNGSAYILVFFNLFHTIRSFFFLISASHNSYLPHGLPGSDLHPPG